MYQTRCKYPDNKENKTCNSESSRENREIALGMWGWSLGRNGGGEEHARHVPQAAAHGICTKKKKTKVN